MRLVILTAAALAAAVGCARSRAEPTPGAHAPDAAVATAAEPEAGGDADSDGDGGLDDGDGGIAGFNAGPIFASSSYPVPPPPFTEGVFPCMDCHESIETDPTPRTLVDDHTEIKLHHGDRDRWCFDCHNPDDRNQLRLASGRTVPFTESYRLCGQCHGDKYRDWRYGIHGKRTGSWNGKKQYLLCAHCHNPHAPHFAPIKPMPPPRRPGRRQ